jgi:CTD nuclear envelope phosphatase 1
MVIAWPLYVCLWFLQKVRSQFARLSIRKPPQKNLHKRLQVVLDLDNTLIHSIKKEPAEGDP